MEPDARITIVNRQSAMSCPFRVVGRAGKSLGGGPEWGVECLEPGVNFWGICFPEKAQARSEQEAVDALVECAMCHFRELAQLTLEEYRSIVSQGLVQRDCPECGVVTGWGFSFVEEEPEESVTVLPGGGPSAAPAAQRPERRRAKRVTIKMPVRIRVRDGPEEVAWTENLSKTGVCFASRLMLRSQDRILLTVGYRPAGSEKEIPARVVWRRELEEGGKALYGVHLEESKEE